jgi:hypothetical protein
MNQGSIKIEQLQVSNLIVNYCLYLLSKEIEANSSLGEIQFENFSLIGSMKKGIKVSTANQLDNTKFPVADLCIRNGRRSISDFVPVYRFCRALSIIS